MWLSITKAISYCWIQIDSRRFAATILLKFLQTLHERNLHVNKHVSIFRGLFLVLVAQFSIAAFGQMPALSPLPQTGTLTPPANSAQFNFVIAGDNRPAKKSCKQPPTPGQI